MVAGTVLGWAAPDTAVALRPLANVFLWMIKSVIAPLIFATLVVGIAGHGNDIKKVGRLALKAIVYFEVVTTLALAVGLLVVNVMRPGAGVQLHPGLPAAATAPVEQPSVSSVLRHLVPDSVIQAAAQNEILQIVFWSVLFAIALTQVHGRPKDAVLGFCEGLSEVMFKFTRIVMFYAPIGIGAAIAATVGHLGLESLSSLGKLVLTLYIALAIFCLAVLLPVTWLARVPLKPFLKAVKEPALIAFSSAASEAALPIALERMERLGVPRRIVAFVLPTGYTFNLDGSTLYLAVASLFAAQAAGISLTLSQQLLMMLTLMLTSKGVAGVPRASLVILAGTAASFHLPADVITAIFGVDVLMDMARTSVNVVGNCLASVVTARWEGEFSPRGAAAGGAGSASAAAGSRVSG
jgi:proton glutamate symport protein